MKRHIANGKSNAVGVNESKFRSMTSDDLNTYPGADIKCLIDDTTSKIYVFLYDKPASQLSIIGGEVDGQINVEVPGQAYGEELVDKVKDIASWEDLKKQIEKNDYRFELVTESANNVHTGKLFKRRIGENLTAGHTYQFNDGSGNSKDAKFIKSSPSISGTKQHQFELTNFGIKVWVQDGDLSKRIIEGKVCESNLTDYSIEIELRDGVKAQELFRDQFSKVGHADSTTTYSFKNEEDMEDFKSALQKQNIGILKISGPEIDESLNESRVKAFFNELSKTFPKLKEKDLQDIADDLDHGKEQGVLHRNYYKICTLLHITDEAGMDDVVSKLFDVWGSVRGEKPKETIESIKEDTENEKAIEDAYLDKLENESDGDAGKAMLLVAKDMDISINDVKNALKNRGINEVEGFGTPEDMVNFLIGVLDADHPEPHTQEDIISNLTQKFALPHSLVMKQVIDGLKEKGYKVAESTNEGEWFDDPTTSKQLVGIAKTAADTNDFITKVKAEIDLDKNKEADLELWYKYYTDGKINEAIELVHVYTDATKKEMFGTGELTGKKENKGGIDGEYVKLDSQTEKWFPSDQIALTESTTNEGFALYKHDGKITYKIPVAANTVKELVANSIENEDVENFLAGELGADEAVETSNGKIFTGAEIMNFINSDESIDEAKWDTTNPHTKIRLLNQISTNEGRKANLSAYHMFEYKDLPNTLKKSLTKVSETFLHPDCAVSRDAWDAISKMPNPARFKRLGKELAIYNNRNTTTFEIKLDAKSGELFVDYGDAWTTSDVRYRELISILNFNGFKRAKYQNDCGVILGKPAEEEQVDESLKLYEEATFPSQFGIDDQINFIPSAKQCEDMAIERSPRIGTIVGVRFSKAKVFYDVLDDYYGIIFTKLDSSFVTATQAELQELLATMTEDSSISGHGGGTLSMDIEPLEFTPMFEEFVSKKKILNESATSLYKSLEKLKSETDDANLKGNIDHILNNIVGFYHAVAATKEKDEIEKDTAKLTDAVSTYVSNKGDLSSKFTPIKEAKKEKITRFQIEMAEAFVESFTKYTPITEKNRKMVIDDMKVTGFKNVPEELTSAVLDGILAKKSTDEIHKLVNEEKIATSKTKRINEVKCLSSEDAERDFPGYDGYPNISKSGSLTGMKQQYGWDTSYVVQIGNYYYNLKSHPKMQTGGMVVANEDGERENQLIDGQLVKISDPDYSLNNGFYGYVQSIGDGKVTVSIHSTQADGKDILTKEYEIDKVTGIDDNDNITAHDLNEEGTFNGKSAKDYVIELLGRVTNNEWTTTQFVNWAMRNKYYLPNALAVGLESVFSPKNASTENFEAMKSKVIGYYKIEDVCEYDNEDKRFYVINGIGGTKVGHEKSDKTKEEFPINDEEYDEWLKNKTSGAELFKAKGGVVEELNENDSTPSDIIDEYVVFEKGDKTVDNLLEFIENHFEKDNGKVDQKIIDQAIKELERLYPESNESVNEISDAQEQDVFAMFDREGYDDTDFENAHKELMKKFPSMTREKSDELLAKWLKSKDTNEDNSDPDFTNRDEMEEKLALKYKNITKQQDGDDTVYLDKGVEVARWHNNDDYGAFSESTNEDELDGIQASYTANPESGETLDFIKSFLAKNPITESLTILEKITGDSVKAKMLYKKINEAKIDDETFDKITTEIMDKISAAKLEVSDKEKIEKIKNEVLTKHNFTISDFNNKLDDVNTAFHNEYFNKTT